MTEASTESRLLFLGGLAVLAASHLSLLSGPLGAWGAALSFGGVAIGYLLLATGAWRARPSTTPAAAPPAQIVLPAQAHAAPVGGFDAGGWLESFDQWLAEQEGAVESWPAFDQWVREGLAQQLGFARVRCYAMAPGAGLTPLSRTAGRAEPHPSDPLVQHVGATGNEFVRQAAGCAPLHDELSAGENNWDWVWRVADASGPRGVIAATMNAGVALPDATQRRLLRGLLTLQWRHVSALERLGVVSRTDKASGVMTRADFLESAARVVEGSAAEHEPLVVVALVIEGLRGLDDVGAWSERDALIAHIGRSISRRTRADDLLGRFSDQGFVVLLRRMDIGLGRLIADKLLAAAQECAAQVRDASGTLVLRAGLAGGAGGPHELRPLLTAAFNAAEQARRIDERLVCAAPAALAGALP